MPRRTLILFAKTPRFGLVKSRLARDIGISAATRWYRRTLSETMRRLYRPGRWDCVLFGAPRHAAGWPWPRVWSFRHQARGDLGNRMLRALRSFQVGPTLLIGSDIPGIGPDEIEAAFRALGRARAVLGPSEDGGYWLIGFAPLYRGNPFRAVRWSSAHALEDTLAGFPKRARVGFAKRLRDVDTGADLEKLRKSGRTARARAGAA